MEHISKIIPRSLAELRSYWQAEAEAMERRRANVDGATLAREFMAQLAAVEQHQDDELLSPADAAKVCGYNPDSLVRLARKGQLANLGSQRRPKYRRSDLPAKARGARAEKVSRILADVDSLAREAVAGRARGR